MVSFLFSLTGCANAALAVTDPRSLSTVTSDQYITRDLSIKYMGSEFESDHVSATVYNHEVLLTGQTSSLAQRIKIVRTAKEFDSVQKFMIMSKFLLNTFQLQARILILLVR